MRKVLGGYCFSLSVASCNRSAVLSSCVCSSSHRASARMRSEDNQGKLLRETDIYGMKTTMWNRQREILNRRNPRKWHGKSLRVEQLTPHRSLCYLCADNWLLPHASSLSLFLLLTPSHNTLFALTKLLFSRILPLSLSSFCRWSALSSFCPALVFSNIRISVLQKEQRNQRKECCCCSFSFTHTVVFLLFLTFFLSHLCSSFPVSAHTFLFLFSHQKRLYEVGYFSSQSPIAPQLPSDWSPMRPLDQSTERLCAHALRTSHELGWETTFMREITSQEAHTEIWLKQIKHISVWREKKKWRILGKKTEGERW